MTKEEAVARAAQALPAHKLPDEAQATTAELRWIELAAADPATPGPVRDAKAWVVRFELNGGPVAELAVGDRTGKVVRVERFR